MDGFSDDALILDGIAELALEGRTPARAYRELSGNVCVAPVADLFAACDGAGRRSQLLFGERFDGLAARQGRLYGRARRTGALGWVNETDLASYVAPPTHRVALPDAPLTAAPSLDGARRGRLSVNALVRVLALQDGLARIGEDLWVPAGALTDLHAFATDPAEVAERRLGAPVLDRGRGPDGLDGPGLVQEALFACGLACPSDPQRLAFLGRASASPRRGDIVVWADGAGVMSDAEVLTGAARGDARIRRLALADLAGRAPAARRVTPAVV